MERMSGKAEEGFLAPVNNEIDRETSSSGQSEPPELELETEILLENGRTQRTDLLNDTEPLQINNSQTSDQLKEENQRLQDEWLEHNQVEFLRNYNSNLEQELNKCRLQAYQAEKEKDEYHMRLDRLKFENEQIKTEYSNKIAALTTKVNEKDNQQITANNTQSEWQARQLKEEKDRAETRHCEQLAGLPKKIDSMQMHECLEGQGELYQRPISSSTAKFGIPKLDVSENGSIGYREICRRREQELKDSISHNSGTRGVASLGPVVDSLLTPKMFSGKEDSQEWVDSFMTFMNFKGMTDEQITQLLPLWFVGTAKIWYHGLSEDTKASKAELLDAFQAQFALSKTAKWKQQSQMWEKKMLPSESVADYMAEMKKLAAKIKADEATTMGAILKGLRSNIRTIVIPLNPNNIRELEEMARRAEDAISNESNSNEDVLKAIKELHKRLETTSTAQNTGPRENTEQDKEILIAAVKAAMQSNKMNDSNSQPNSGRFNGERRQTPARSTNDWNRMGNNTQTYRRYNDQSNNQAFEPFNQRRAQEYTDQGTRRWGNPSFTNQSRQGRFPNSPRCYKCNSPHHLARNCDQLGRETQQYRPFQGYRPRIPFTRSQ